MAFENINSRCVWRYSLNFGEYGGLVFASSKENATEKILKKYGEKYKEFYLDIWEWENDDYFDKNNLDVFELYSQQGKEV